MVTVRVAQIADTGQAWSIRTEAIIGACPGYYPAEIIAAWAYGEMPEAFANRLVAEGCVASIGNRVVGFGALLAEKSMVDGLFVHPDCMGQGIGRQLLACLETMAHERGIERLSLDASLNAAPFYRACGYRGTEVSVYHSPRGIDLACIPMAKKLRAGMIVDHTGDTGD